MLYRQVLSLVPLLTDRVGSALVHLLLFFVLEFGVSQHDDDCYGNSIVLPLRCRSGEGISYYPMRVMATIGEIKATMAAAFDDPCVVPSCIHIIAERLLTDDTATVSVRSESR